MVVQNISSQFICMGTILSLKWKWIYFLNIYLILDIDECIDDTQCYNNGTCVNTPGSYTCNCSLGWGGSKCETGKLFCLMFHLSFVCFVTIRLNLKLRFSFLNYITYRNSFLSNRCLNFIENKKGNKKDIESMNKYIYTIIFFSLTSIITDVNECLDTSVCNTSCINTPGSFWCLCEAGWTGQHCDQGNLSILFVELSLSLLLPYRIEYIYVVVFVQERFVPYIKTSST